MRKRNKEISATSIYNDKHYQGHINILVSSLVYGGAERIVYETVEVLKSINCSVNLFVLFDNKPSFEILQTTSVRVMNLAKLNRREKIEFVAREVLSSPNSIIFTHLIRLPDLEILWSKGVKTVPVIHNSKPGWQNSPDIYSINSTPFVIACCYTVREELLRENCKVPVFVIKHELQFQQNNDFSYRTKIRNEYRIEDDCLLIGLIGKFKPQKAYHRAVEILFEVKKHRNAKLIILGGWDRLDHLGKISYQKLIDKAGELNLINDIILPGDVSPIENWIQAFDVFLNCSDYEGYSIATLEALQSGCPCVLADVGGQSELPPNYALTLISSPFKVEDFAKKIISLEPKSHHPNLSIKSLPKLIPYLWLLTSNYWGLKLTNPQSKIETLFIINNLRIGGAQKSLINLITSKCFPLKCTVVVLDENSETSLVNRLISAGISVWFIKYKESIVEQANEILLSAREIGAQKIVFWNASPRLKVLIAKIVEFSSIKLIDVSPGSKYFFEINETESFIHRISFSIQEYGNRLNTFIYKYSKGHPPLNNKLQPKVCKLIPNGVENTKVFNIPRKNTNRRIKVGTSTRITPIKKISWLMSVMEIVSSRTDKIDFMIAGEPEIGKEKYWIELQKKLQQLNLDNIQFVGKKEKIFDFLYNLDIFLLVALPGGCPNSSLEAMTVGLPIIATDTGGAPDQVQNGINGYLIDPYKPNEMAGRIIELSINPTLRKSMGVASKKIATEKFSLERMVNSYLEILS